MTHRWKNILITADNTIREALTAINDEALRIALLWLTTIKNCWA